MMSDHYHKSLGHMIVFLLYDGTMAITVLKLRPFGFLPGFTSVVWAQPMETGGISIADFVSMGVNLCRSYNTMDSL